MNEKLTLDSPEKSYAQTAPGRGLLSKKNTHRKKQARAEVPLPLGPGLYGLLGPNGAGNLSSSEILSRQGFLRS